MHTTTAPTRPLFDTRWLREALERLADAARRLREAQASRQFERATRQTLAGLDDRTLRDLGFVRSEIGSVARELGAPSPSRRVRAFSTALR